MHFRSLYKSIRHLLAICLILAVCADLVAQEDSVVLSNERVQQLISELDAADFKTRQAATSALINAGDQAMAALAAAISKSSLEQRVRIDLILKRLQRNSFQFRLNELQQHPSAEIAAGMPEWKRFSQRCGDDPKAVEFYLRLLKAEPALFRAAMNRPADLRVLLEERSSELLQAMDPVPTSADQFTVDSYAALLLLASNQDITLRGGTSTAISTMLHFEDFTTLVQQEDDGHRYRCLAGAWILRDRISVVHPLKFARQFPMKEGLALARKVVRTALRGQNGRFAYILILEQGSEADLPLLESSFENRGVLVEGTKTNQQYKAYNGDMALAVAIRLRGQDPREFGFAKEDRRGGEFEFSSETIGFESDEERAAARSKYARLFLKQSAQQPQ